MDTIKIEKNGTRMIAHAGLMGMESSNTNAGFIAAGNRTYYGVETDVRVTGDKQIAVLHNPTTAGISPVELVVAESTLKELQSIPLYDRPFFYGMENYGVQPLQNALRSDLHIPSLAEYIHICKKYGKICVLELKSEMSPDDVANILSQYKEQDYEDSVIYISFNRETLKELRKQAPDAVVQLLTNEKQVFSDEFLDEVAADGFDLDIHIFTATKELVERIHARGRQVNVWTCDWPERAAELVEWGVDMITTNILE